MTSTPQLSGRPPLRRLRPQPRATGQPRGPHKQNGPLPRQRNSTTEAKKCDYTDLLFPTANGRARSSARSAAGLGGADPEGIPCTHCFGRLSWASGHTMTPATAHGSSGWWHMPSPPSLSWRDRTSPVDASFDLGARYYDAVTGITLSPHTNQDSRITPPDASQHHARLSTSAIASAAGTVLSLRCTGVQAGKLACEANAAHDELACPNLRPAELKGGGGSRRGCRGLVILPIERRS